MDRNTVIMLIQDVYEEMYDQRRTTTKEIERSCYEEAAIDGLCKYISVYAILQVRQTIAWLLTSFTTSLDTLGIIRQTEVKADVYLSVP